MNQFKIKVGRHSDASGRHEAGEIIITPSCVDLVKTFGEDKFEFIGTVEDAESKMQPVHPPAGVKGNTAVHPAAEVQEVHDKLSAQAAPEEQPAPEEEATKYEMRKGRRRGTWNVMNLSTGTRMNAKTMSEANAVALLEKLNG